MPFFQFFSVILFFFSLIPLLHFLLFNYLTWHSIDLFFFAFNHPVFYFSYIGLFTLVFLLLSLYQLNALYHLFFIIFFNSPGAVFSGSFLLSFSFSSLQSQNNFSFLVFYIYLKFCLLILFYFFLFFFLIFPIMDSVFIPQNFLVLLIP